MALYSITNISPGTVVLPPPIGKRLNKGERLKISKPAGMTEVNFNRQYSAITKMAKSGLIHVLTIEDPDVDDNIEVATVSMLNGGSSSATTFDAAFTGLLAFGDLVHVKTDGSVELVDITDFDKMPAIGMVVATAGLVATVQTSGLVTGLTGLIAGRQHFVGLTGQPVYLPPWPTPPVRYFHQLVGIARQPTILSLDFVSVMTRVR